MTHPNHAVVTGAFSYTGGYIARRLLEHGTRVTTLTRHPDLQNAFSGRVESAPLDFTDKQSLIRSMQGTSVFYNTYWIRFEHGETTFERAVANSTTLFEAAIDAGISKIVHISVSNPAPNSRLSYFAGKWHVEETLKSYGVPYAIIRPTLVFGNDDLLLNNIAWALRRFPFFPVYGNGSYQVQPIFAEDLATQAVAAAPTTENSTADAAGPDTMTCKELLQLMASKMRVTCGFVLTPPSIGLALTNVIGLLMRDTVLTRDEIDGLMEDLLTSDQPPTGTTRFRDWLTENANSIGRRYHSELDRNFRL